MFVIRYRKIWYALSGALLILSAWAIFQYGFNFSIDFKGGTITEVSYASRPEKAVVEEKVEALDLGGFSVRPSGADRYVVRTRELDGVEQQALLAALGAEQVERQNSIGPVAGAELRSKAVKAIAVVVAMIVLFITFAFRRVSTTAEDRARGLPPSWKYGLATIIALAHDVIIPAGIFAWLGYTAGVEIDLLFVTGLLAILGYSVHDSIVVFDRVRENLSKHSVGNPEEFERLVGASISQTFARSINTSVTIFITLLALYIYGSAATETFALLLLIGVVIGTYSSVFIGSPLLVTFSKLQKKG